MAAHQAIHKPPNPAIVSSAPAHAAERQSLPAGFDFNRKPAKSAAALSAEHRALSLSTPHIIQPGETFFGLGLELKRQAATATLSAAQLADRLEKFHGKALKSGERINLAAFMRSLGIATDRRHPKAPHSKQPQQAYISSHAMAQIAERVSERLRDRGIEISPQRLMAHASKESSFDRLAVGKAGELGLTQIKPQLAREHWPKDGICGFKRFRRALLFNAEVNLELNGIIVDDLANRHGGRNQALLAYHLGETGWSRVSWGPVFSGLRAARAGYVRDINLRERHFEYQHFPPLLIALWRKLTGKN